MNDLSEVRNTTLPMLIDRAAGALTTAKSSAEVLEARDLSRVAYDAAKSAGRMARAKRAHEEIIAAVYRAQADALLIEARAKMRLADEYDAAQERGEVAKVGNPSIVGGDNDRPTAADIGLRRDEIHEARVIRNAEQADPGRAERVLSEIVESGEEPTKAKLRKAMTDESEPEHQDEPKEPDPHAKLRAEFRKLSDEGKEEDWIGLRLETKDLRKRVTSQRSEIADLKAQIKELTSDEDANRKLGNMQRRLRQSEGRMKEHQTSAARLQRQVNAQQAEIAKLKKRLENQEIQLS